MLKRKRTVTIFVILSLLVLSFSSVALANNGTEAQVNESRALNVQEYQQENKQEQIRAQECEGECSENCEPQQRRLQQHKQENRQELQGGRNQGNGKGLRQAQNLSL